VAATEDCCAQPRTAQRTAYFHVSIKEDGEADLSVHLLFVPSDPQRLQQGMSKLFNGPIEEPEIDSQPQFFEIRARFANALRRERLTVAGKIDLTPLKEALFAQGVQKWRVIISHPELGFSHSSSGTQTRFALSGVSYHLDDDLPGSFTEPVELSFGFETSDLWRLVPLGLILLLPLGPTWWMWRQAQAAREADPFAVWFGCWRFQRRLTFSLWCVWLVAIPLLNAARLVGFVLDGTLGISSVAWIVGFLGLPPILSLGVCKWLTRKVFVLPELGWNGQHVSRQVLWSHLALGFLVLGSAFFIDKFTQHDTRLGWQLLGGSLVAFVVCGSLWLQAKKLRFVDLPAGELRERIDELMERAAVHANHVYLLSPAQWRLVNHFLGSAPFIFLTAPLLVHHSKREVDALVAHELAFIWRRRVRVLWMPLAEVLLGAVIGVALGILYYLQIFDLGRSWPMLIAFAVAFHPLYRFRLQGFAPNNDAAAARISGDAEALLTALAKLDRQRLLPAHGAWWADEKGRASALRARLEALAECADIAPDRLQEILEGPGTGITQYAPLPAEFEQKPSGAPAAETGFKALKARVIRLLPWEILGLCVLPPALTATSVQLLGWEGWPKWISYLAAVVLAWMAVKSWLRFRSRRLYAEQERWLHANCQARGMAPAEYDCTFIGLSPEAMPRFYDGFSDWDLGYLLLIGDCLCYLGGQTRFVLGREQVRAIQADRAHPEPRGARRVYLTWSDEKTGGEKRINLAPADATALRHGHRNADDLATRLQRWLRENTVPVELPRCLADLSAPEFPPVSSLAPQQIVHSGHLIVHLIWSLMPAVLLSLLLGLSFESSKGGAGWYVVFAVFTLFLLRVKPYWGYRDPNPE
jgi:Zn-dependent protease with chaperone function